MTTRGNTEEENNGYGYVKRISTDQPIKRVMVSGGVANPFYSGLLDRFLRRDGSVYPPPPIFAHETF
jgi:hypothetical protein